MKTNVIVILAMVLSATALDAQAVEILGFKSCGKWVQDRTENSWPALINRNWLFGYISGLAVAKSKDFLGSRPDVASLELWVDNYCRSNPLNNLDAAGNALALELMKKNGL